MERMELSPGPAKRARTEPEQQVPDSEGAEEIPPVLVIVRDEGCAAETELYTCERSAIPNELWAKVSRSPQDYTLSYGFCEDFEQEAPALYNGIGACPASTLEDGSRNPVVRIRGNPPLSVSGVIFIDDAG